MGAKPGTISIEPYSASAVLKAAAKAGQQSLPPATTVGIEKELPTFVAPFEARGFLVRILCCPTVENKVGRQVAVLNKESGVDETLLLRGYKLLSDIALGKYPEGIQHMLVICTADGNTEAQFTSFPQLALDAADAGLVVCATLVPQGLQLALKKYPLCGK